VLQKSVAAAGIGTASLLLCAASAHALGSTTELPQVPVRPAAVAGDPILDSVCLLPFTLAGPYADTLGKSPLANRCFPI
jgi:hypothetical protein